MSKENKENNVIGERLKKIREKKGLSRAKLATALGIGENSVYSYEKGIRMPGADVLSAIAEYLDVSIAFFTGETDIPVETGGMVDLEMPIETVALPVYESVSCGNGSIAMTEPIGIIPKPDNIVGDFWVVAKGDSMEPNIQDGDFLLISTHEQINNGDLVIIVVDDEVYCKFFSQNENNVILHSANPKYPPMVISKQQANMNINGKVTSLSRRL